MMQISFALLSYLKIKTIYTLYIGPTPRPKHHISNPTTTFISRVYCPLNYRSKARIHQLNLYWYNDAVGRAVSNC